MRKTSTAWILLTAGAIFFASCQSNNKPVATSEPVAPATANNPDTGPLPGVAANNSLPADTGSSASATSATDNSVTTSGTATTTTSGTSIGTAASGSSSEASWTGNKPSCGHRKTHRAVACHSKKAGCKKVTVCRTTCKMVGCKKVCKRTCKKVCKKTAHCFRVEKPVCTEVAVARVEPIRETYTPPPPVITYESPAVFTGHVPEKVSKVHWGIEGGINLNNLYQRSESFTASNMIKVGFNAGFIVNIELGKHVGFEPGLRYIMKGGELTNSGTLGQYTFDHKEKLTFHYIEMPLNITYNGAAWGHGGFIAGAGPYVALLVNGQAKVKDKVTGPDGPNEFVSQHELSIGDPNDIGNISSWDAGANAFIGYQMANGVYVKGGAEVGLVDLQRYVNTLGDFYNRNYNFNLNVGYKFGYKKH